MSNGKTPHNKMLIDATHPEETRVVVLRQGRVEEFDYESAARKLLRGNIYLAKVTRVEPSLQAAFVDYGGNRHGFLAFNEIHPDYYQIPVADRRALIEAEAAEEAEAERAADAAAEARAARYERRDRARGQGGGQHQGGGRRGSSQARDEADEHGHDRDHDHDHDHIEDVGEAQGHDHGHDDHDEGHGHDHDHAHDHEREHDAADAAEARAVDVTHLMPPETPAAHDDHSSPEEPGTAAAAVSGSDPSISAAPASADDRGGYDAGEAADAPHAVGLVEDVGVTEVDGDENGAAEAEQVESVGSEDALEELPSRPRRRQRSYKIQEVIKRRQVILVQVVKEERGTKGAALTTYLSLAGRYTVLMPNTARGGGISRKITNAQDRKRLKAIAEELEVPEGMGLIIRTAGAARTKQEIKRDFEYLIRLWESVRDLAVSPETKAPSLVYEEGNLIKRSIRDLYGKEVEEVIVAGDVAFAEARDFMRMLMPSHAKNVLPYTEPEPLFNRYQIERQLNAMFSPYVHLRSGGYLVINQTEALVAVDVNSGKATREFSIEETALNTNLEAADEIARQLKLRDLAGLIVIDFIDMEEKRNNRNVERRLKDALRFDRARIQVGRISHFGLMEMSRQRLRTGVLEGSTTQCPHCQGTGIIRSTESVALAVIRALEDALMAGQPQSLSASTTASVALYILNHKRDFINDMERRYDVTITIQASDKLQGANFTIDKVARREEPQRRPERAAVNMDWGFEGEAEGEAEVEGDVEDADEGVEAGDANGDGRGEQAGGEGGRRRRRRRRRGRRDERGEMSANGESNGQGNGNGAPHGRVEQALESGAGFDDDFGDDRAAPVHGDDEDQGVETIGGAEADDDGEGEGERDREALGDREPRRGRRRRRGRRGGRRDGGRDQQPMPVDSEQPDLPEGAMFAPREGIIEPARPRRIEIDEPAASTGSVSRPIEEPAPMAAQDHAPRPVEPAAPAMAAEPARVEAAPVEPKPVVEAKPAEPAAVSQPQPPAESPRAARVQPVASEPIIERVRVGSDAAPVSAPESEAKPVRKGWWQRQFGAE